MIIYLGGLGNEVGVGLWVKSFITRHSFVYMVQAVPLKMGMRMKASR